MKSTPDRLRAVMEKGNLRVSDLARWFDRPYPTIRSWVQGVEMGGGAIDKAFILAKLAKLEKLTNKGPLIKPGVPKNSRIAALEKIKARAGL